MARKSAHAKGITGGGPKMCSAGPLGLPLRMAHVKGLSLGVDETAAFCVIVSVPKSRDPLNLQLHALVFNGVVQNKLQINLRDPLNLQASRKPNTTNNVGIDMGGILT